MTREMNRLERPVPLHQTVQDAIREYILDNALQPGDPMLPETELAKQLGVSRNSVREAVKSLEGMGILEARRGSGLYVREFSWDPLLDNLAYDLMQDIRSLAELLEIREVLEAGLLNEAIRELTDDQRRDLQALVESMKARATRGENPFEEDRAFHNTMFRELNNITLLRLLDIFWLALRRASERADLDGHDYLDTYRSHRYLLDTLVAGDVEAAQNALREHYRVIRDRLESKLESQDATSPR